MKVRSSAVRGWALAGLAACALPVLAQVPAATAALQVYRCPGPPVLYTDALSPAEAREKGCRTIEGTPITIIQAPRPRAAASGTGGNGNTSAAPRPADSKVDPASQRQRDSEARRILLEELKKEEESSPARRRTTTTASPTPRRRTQLPALPGPRGRHESRDHAQGSRHFGLRREIAKLPAP